MNEKPKETEILGDDLTLESILAEYKSEAFTAGQKKTAKEDLDRETEQILKETRLLPKLEDVEPTLPPVAAAEPTILLPKIKVEEPVTPVIPVVPVEPEVPTVPTEVAEETLQLPPVTHVELSMPQATTPPTAQAIPEQVVEPVRRQKLEQDQVVSIELRQNAYADDDGEYYAEEARIEEFAARLEEVEAEFADDEDDEGGSFFSRFRRGRKGRREAAPEPDEFDFAEGQYDAADILPDDLNPIRAAGKYGKGLAGCQVRGMGTILLALLMLLFTGIADGGGSLPWFLGTIGGLTATLLVLQLIAMFLTAEVITTGLLDLFRRRIGVETLVTVAALASIADAVWVLREGASGRGMPYAAVAAFALGTALLGIKSTRNAMKTTLRAAATGMSPYVVMNKLEEKDEGFLLFKARGETEGFVRKTEQMDFSEHVYTMAAPLLLVMSVVFALVAAFGGGGEAEDALHYFAAMALVSASFTGLLAYGVPYAMLARKLAKMGTALAGWGGAADVREAKGIIVTDQDVFPAGTVTLGGVKILRNEDSERRRVIASVSSLMIASGSGLSEVFLDILQREEIAPLPVEDLTCYEGGGFGAKVGAQEIIVGSASLMNLMGVRLPQDLNLKNAVFAAVGGELAGVFAINYVPQASVMQALVSLLQTRLRPLLAVRDFNITPMMLQNKFNIATDKIDFLTYEARYALSGLAPDERTRPFAVLHREGLRPLADVIIGGKRLRTAVIRNTILSVASSVIGLVLLLSFFWAGAADTANAVNLFYYMAAWLVVLGLTSRTVNLD